MCTIQKALRPQFLASPNEAPLQVDSRKSGSRSSSQERPFLGPELIKPRCVWAPNSVRLGTWAFTRWLLSEFSAPCQALGKLGARENREVSDYCLQKGGGCPI